MQVHQAVHALAGRLAAASVMAARSLASGTRMSPHAEVTAENVPSDGVWL
jgi:hypothetical protein